ncbi:MAG: hypothetical protein IJ690_06515 [Clostridia bacterium]|nr:hypothetical protein [Clostridia bacterium]
MDERRVVSEIQKLQEKGDATKPNRSNEGKLDHIDWIEGDADFNPYHDDVDWCE